VVEELSEPVTEVQTPPESKPAEKPVVVTKPKAAPVKELSKPIVKPIDSGSLKQVFRVKLGSFSQQGNAEKVKSALLQKNIKAIVEYNPGLKLYRVWSQELYQDEGKANTYVKAVDQLKLNIGTPKVVTLSAEEVSQMASQGQMGWVVQLGSFSAKENAIELRNKVKAAGFAGFVDTIKNSKGVSLYRLRIGPLMEKMDAEKTQSEIKQKLKLDGLIKNHEFGQIVD
jgi:DedD protein